jgi:hypothetical protein
MEIAMDIARANFRKRSSYKYNLLDAEVSTARQAAVGSDNPMLVPIENLMKEFEAVTPSSGIAAGSAHPYLQNLKDRIIETASQWGGKALPYDEFVNIRRSLGNKMNNHNFFTDAPQADLKRLFGAYSDDFDNVAKRWDSHYGTNIRNRAAAATTHYRKGRELFDDTLGFLSKKLDKEGVASEDVFAAILSNSKRAPSRITAMMKALDMHRVPARNSSTLTS